eukprot:TRINITY_DN12897_c0_g1_i3.p1 TRINITY_DN12897_c0_g1~~TRINITY_DN12897_c0_g1_i3.p1  ORF type:complete len:458 (-),score=84.85 TRINITY_DN12897_c0_g1_i3:14-1387(-)
MNMNGFDDGFWDVGNVLPRSLTDALQIPQEVLEALDFAESIAYAFPFTTSLTASATATATPSNNEGDATSQQQQDIHISEQLHHHHQQHIPSDIPASSMPYPQSSSSYPSTSYSPSSYTTPESTFSSTSPFNNNNNNNNNNNIDGVSGPSRRSKQNIASQEYRKRKRERVETLERTVAMLTKQLDDAKKELDTLKAVDSLEPMMHSSTFQKLNIEGHSIIKVVGEALKQNSHSSGSTHEPQLSHLCRLFWSNFELTRSHALVEMKRWIHPVPQLIIMCVLGYSLTDQRTLAMRFIPHTPWWTQFCEDASLSNSIINLVKNISDTYQTTIDVIFNDRRTLCEKIKNLFILLNPGPVHVIWSSPNEYESCPDIDTSRAKDLSLQIHQTSELLAANFASQVKIVDSTHMQIASLLSPRQQAQMIVRAFSRHRASYCETPDSIKTFYSLIRNQPLQPTNRH